MNLESALCRLPESQVLNEYQMTASGSGVEETLEYGACSLQGPRMKVLGMHA